jgi:hypothetical protein
MRSSLYESVIVAEFQATEACSCLDLIEAKYRCRKKILLFELALVISVHVKMKIDMTMKLKFKNNVRTQILNSICSQ